MSFRTQDGAGAARAPGRLRLVAVFCGRCRRFLTDAIPGADVRCPRCDRWVRAVAPEQRLIDFDPPRRRGRPV